jgi:glucosamine kinase
MILCIDAGASSAKWTLKTSTGFKRGAVGPITGHLFTDEAKAAATAELTQIAADAGKVDQVVLGITGVDKGNPVAAELVANIAQIFDIAASQVLLMNDMELAYSAVFAPGEGVLVYAGTGAIASQIDETGNFIRAGGWGFHIGDFGAGYSIGIAALRYVTGLWDQGKDPLQDEFAAAVMDFANCKDWPDLRIYIYGNGRSAIAAIAPIVGKLADQGNDVAQLLIQDAALALAELAQHIMDRTGASKVIAMGGTFKISDQLFAEFVAALGSPAELIDTDIAELWLSRNS